MTFREYWRALGFGAFSTKARCFVDQTITLRANDTNQIVRLQASHDKELQFWKGLFAKASDQFQQSVSDRMEYHKAISDRALQKAGIRPVYEKPPQGNKREPQPVGSFAELDVDYDRIQAEDRKRAGLDPNGD